MITGTATQGQTLTTTNGTWSGNPTPTYAYQWRRNGTAISGAAAQTYLLAAADVGANITCAVTATNSAGSATAISNSVGPVQSAGATFSDNFTGDANLGDRSGWNFVSGGQTVAQSTGGQLATTATTESVWQSMNIGSANNYVEARLVGAGINNQFGPFLCSRLTDANNWVGVRNNGTAGYQVFKRVGGTLTQLGAPAQASAVNDMVRLEASGDNVSLIVNGVNLGTWSLTGDLANVVRQGIVARTSARNPWIDDYKAGTL